MKKLLRKLVLSKAKTDICRNDYVVITRTKYGYYNYDILNEKQLKRLLIEPKERVELIFKYKDRLEIETEFVNKKEEE